MTGVQTCALPISAIAWGGWYYFWCQPFDAVYTKGAGIALLITCGSAFLSLVFGSTDVGGKPFNAGGSIGNWVGGWFAEYLNRTGSIIVLLTVMVLSVIVSTQFSFGRLFADATTGSRDLSARGLGWLQGWWDDRRRAKKLSVPEKLARKPTAPDQQIGRAHV